MVESKKFQISVLKRMLEKYGLEADLVDLESLVDSDLSLEENAGIIRREYGLVDNKVETRSQVKLDNFFKAVENFSKLSQRKQRMDFGKRAVTTFSKSELSDKNFEKWNNNKNRFDVEGVDSR